METAVIPQLVLRRGKNGEHQVFMGEHGEQVGVIDHDHLHGYAGRNRHSFPGQHSFRASSRLFRQIETRGGHEQHVEVASIEREMTAALAPLKAEGLSPGEALKKLRRINPGLARRHDAAHGRVEDVKVGPRLDC